MSLAEAFAGHPLALLVRACAFAFCVSLYIVVTRIAWRALRASLARFDAALRRWFR